MINNSEIETELLRHSPIEKKQKTKKYNLIFSIGSGCSCSYHLRRLGLQKESLPFDWVTNNSNFTILEAFENNFKDYCKKENMQFVRKNGDSSVYKDTKYNIEYVHDIKNDFEKDYDVLYEKIQRRIKRLIDKIKVSKNILLVYETPEYNINEELIINFSEKISKLYSVQCDLLYIIHSKSPNVPIYGYNINDNIKVLYFDNKGEDWRGNEKSWNEIFSNIKLDKNRKIKIAFIKYDGLLAGGTERWLQNVAAKIDKNKFIVDYYYSGHEDSERLKFMQENNINLIKIQCDGKYSPYGEWKNNNLFQKFNENDYDIVQNAIAGDEEWPFNVINIPIVESVHLDYGVNKKDNVYHTFLLSKWMQKKWANMGGIKILSSVAPVGVEMPKTDKDLREELNIPLDAIVIGFHQRVDDNIFSEIPMYAYKENEAENHYFVIMGGSKKYSELAQKLQLKNFIQLEHSANKERISMFLNTLDIFAHGRADGETFGYVFVEAKLHNCACISHKTKTSNAHKDTIGKGGFFCKETKEYNKKLKKILENESLRLKFTKQGFEEAKKKYIDKNYVKHIENKYIQIVKYNQIYRIIVKLMNWKRKFCNFNKIIFTEKTQTHKILSILGITIKWKR